MAAWDNVQLAPPPSAPSYAAPNIGIQLGQMLGSLPQDYVQAQQAARQRQLQTMFQPGTPGAQALQRAGVDPSSLYGQLASAGGADTVLPLAQRMQQGQIYNSIMNAGGGGGDIYSAILGQESGNRDSVGDSSAGAIGPAQIMPATFNQYAQKGEDIRDPATNRAVGKRIVDDYQQRYGGDPARIATAYYSGPGNVAPTGSPTPWINDIRPKGGPSVSQYVGQVLGRMPVGRQASAESADQGGASTTQIDPQRFPQRYTPEFAARLEGDADTLRKSAGALSASGFPEGAAKAQLDRADKISGQAQDIRKWLADRAAEQYGVGIEGQKKAVGAVGEAQGKRVGEVIEAGGKGARDTLNDLNVIQDAVRAGGDNILYGPGATEWNKAKQALNNIFPQSGLAEADTIVKMNARLAAAAAKSMTARPSQLEFKTFVANNPGIMNSKAGTIALLDILKQSTQQQINLGREASRVQDPRSWPDTEDAFYKRPENQLKSPFSGQPLGQQAPPQTPAGGAPVRVSNAAERNMLAPGTRYVAPDGTVRTKQ